MQSAGHGPGGAAARTGEVFAKSAAMHGVDVTALREAVFKGSMTASKEAKEEIGERALCLERVTANHWLLACSR